MNIKFKSKNKPVSEVRRLRTTYNKDIGIRSRVIVKTGKGVDTINNNPDLMFNINITPESNRVLLPTDLNQFEYDLQKNIIEKINWDNNNIDGVNVGNEWLVWTTEEQLETIVQTTKIVYDILTPMGIPISNSGTPTPLLSAGAYNMYVEEGNQEKADEFLSKWKPDQQFNTTLAPRAVEEWNRYIELGMDKLINTFHFALDLNNIDCVKDIIKYLYYYSKGHEIRNNETTVRDMYPALLNRYLTTLQGGNIDYMVAYSDNTVGDDTSNPFTPETEKVLCSFA